MTAQFVCRHETSSEDCQLLQTPIDTNLCTHLERSLEEARPRLQRLARRNGVEPASIDDVVQEICVEAWRHLESLREPERLAAWLDGICRNVCKRYLRARRNPLLTGTWPLDGEAEGATDFNLPDPLAIDPAAELERQDMQVLLDRALSYLSEEARALIELYYLAELSQREVAQRLDISLGALEVRLHRTRRQLRQILNNELRADAAEFGLLLNEDEAMGWQETRQWCWICGKQRLRGIFERQPSGVTALRLRCPNCSRHSEYDITHTGNWSCLGNIRSFRPAIKRMLQAGPDFYRTVLRQRCCNICHSIVQFQIIDRSTLDTVDSVYAPLLPGMYIQVVCPLCGDSLSLLLSALLVHPAIRDFLIDRTRLLYEPDSFATFAGQDVIRSRLVDLKTGERLTTMAHPETLEVMTTIRG